MAAALAHILDSLEERGQMLLSVVDNEKVDTLIEAASAVLGDLSQPYNGVLFVLDVERAVGVRHHTEQQRKTD
jgi:nitrogen regulatory protein PII